MVNLGQTIPPANPSAPRAQGSTDTGNRDRIVCGVDTGMPTRCQEQGDGQRCWSETTGLLVGNAIAHRLEDPPTKLGPIPGGVARITTQAAGTVDLDSPQHQASVRPTVFWHRYRHAEAIGRGGQQLETAELFATLRGAMFRQSQTITSGRPDEKPRRAPRR